MSRVAHASLRDGSWIFFRFLDVAEELDLERAATLVRDRGEVRRVALRPEAASSLSVEARPVEVALGARTIALSADRSIEAIVRVRLFRFGAMSIVFEAPIASGTPIAELVPIAAAAWESERLDEIARMIAGELEGVVRACAIDGEVHVGPVVERYGVVLARAIDGDPLAEPDALARVLLGEADPRPLSASEREDVLRDRYRYFADDLVVVHIAGALVLEPSGSVDAVHALELACSQLLELRTYDVLIDRELDRVYAELARAQGAGWWLFGRRHRALSRQAQAQLLELAELADRAENAVKVVADAYLGRIYLGALARMRATSWRDGISRKLALFARVYDVLKEESHAERSLVVELVVVLLIAFEIVMALRGH